MLENYSDILTVDDICAIFHFGKNKVYQMLEENEIPSKKIRRRYLIPKLGIINYLKNISQTNLTVDNKKV